LAAACHADDKNQLKLQVAKGKNQKNSKIFNSFSYKDLQDFSPIFEPNFSHQTRKSLQL
jgi:hypothetical protein